MFLYFGLGFQGVFSNISFSSHALYTCVFGMFIFLLIILVFLVFVSWYSKVFVAEYLENDSLEVFWSVCPALCLVVFAVPSLGVLYYIDNSLDSPINSTLKLVGNQWFWSFSTSIGGVDISSDIYYVPNSDLDLGGFRLLEVDKVIPIESPSSVRILTTSVDVIHSAAFPVLGFKLDAVPGRLNQQLVSVWGLGKFYGQCSEMCGANHSFMPLCVESILQ